MELELPRRAAADVAVATATVVDLTEPPRRRRPWRGAGPARRSRAAAQPMPPVATWAPRAGELPSEEGPAKRSAPFAWLGRHAWAAFALSLVIALAVAGSARIESAASKVPSRDSAGAGDQLPASEGLGGSRLPTHGDETCGRSEETAYF